GVPDGRGVWPAGGLGAPCPLPGRRAQAHRAGRASPASAAPSHAREPPHAPSRGTASVGTPRGIPRPVSPLSAVGAAARMPSRCELSRLVRPFASSPSFRTRSPRTDMTSGPATPSKDDTADDLSPAYSASALATAARRSPEIKDKNRWTRALHG